MGELKILDDCENFVKWIFDITKEYPERNYTLNSQLIRSSISIGSNVAEGSERSGKDRMRFYDIALGSLEECRFQLRFYKQFDKEIDNDLNKIRATIINLKQYARRTLNFARRTP